MNRRVLAASLAAPVAVAIGLLGAQLASGTEEPALLPKDQFTPPTLSTENATQIRERHLQHYAESMVKRAEWLDAFDRSGIDPRSITRRVGVLAEAPAPPPSLAAAIERADVVALGTVISVDYEESASVLSVRVESALKNTNGLAEVTLISMGAPVPLDDNFEEINPDALAIAHSPAWTVLFQGDQAIFLLEKVDVPPEAPDPRWRERHGVDQIYFAFSMIGINPISNGRVSVTEYPGYPAELAGLPVVDAMALLDRLSP